MIRVPVRTTAVLAFALSVACGGDDKAPTGPTADDAVPITSGVAVTGIAGVEEELKLYSIVVPAGATRLTVTTAGGTGDVDLFVRFAEVPTFTTYDCFENEVENDETCVTNDPAAGTWYIMLLGFMDFAGVTLTATVSTTP